MYMSYGWCTQQMTLLHDLQRFFPVTSSSIKNPMRRHNTITQCASGDVRTAIR